MLIYTERIYKALYAHQVDNNWLTYGRDYFSLLGWEVFNKRLNFLQPLMVGSGVRVLIIGSGFGYTAERLIDSGVRNVWCVEPSPYIWDHQQEMRDDVVARTVDGFVGFDDVRGKLDAIGAPNAFQFIIDEDAASAHDDVELESFLGGIDALHSGNPRSVIHFVTAGSWTPERFPFLNWKELDEWEALRPNHTWIGQ